MFLFRALFLLSSWVILNVSASSIENNKLVIPLYVKPLQSSTLLPKASIEYDTFSQKPELKLTEDPHTASFEGKACLGIKEVSGSFKCLQLIQVSKTQTPINESFIVHLSPSLTGDLSNDIAGLDYSIQSTGSSVVRVETLQKGPIPEIKQPIKLVDNKIPEPEVEKTFIQKYWIYLVPLGLMFILSGSGGGDQ